MSFDYKKYSLENLEKWLYDAMSAGEATPQEIYDVIVGVVKEEYYHHKQRTSQAYELLALLNGNGDWKIEDVLKERKYYEGWNSVGITSLTGPDSKEPIVCDKNDPSPECKKSWVDFWEETYYPEEEKLDDGMRPWGHSDLEYMIANPTLTENRISNFPGEQYTEEELNAMCKRAATEELKKECIEQNREYNLREAEYYNKRAQLDAEYEAIKAAGGYEWTPLPPKDKVVKWQLPVEMDDPSGQYFVTFPDDLLEAANLKEGDQVEWVDQGDGSYLLRKV